MIALNTTRNPHTGVRTNDPTLYELAAEHVPSGRRVLLAYCRRRTRAVIWETLSKRIDHVDRVIGTRYVDWARRAADGATMGDWRIIWTGRTEREARGSRPLPFIADVDG